MKKHALLEEVQRFHGDHSVYPYGSALWLIASKYWHNQMRPLIGTAYDPYNKDGENASINRFIDWLQTESLIN